MAEANIDQLTLDIVVKNGNATRRINAITKSIERLNSVLKSSDLDKALDKINNVSPASTGSSGGAKSKDKSWKEQIFSVNEYGKSILTQEMNVSKLNGAVSKQVKYFDTQGNKIKTISTEIDKFGNKITKVQNLANKNDRGLNTKNLNIFATLGKLNYYRNMTRYYGQQLAGLVQSAMEYVETQNLWQVANRENIALASEFINKMNKAYGISEQALMNYQAIFKNMLSALGQLSGASSTALSQSLTQMALDFSSLYNVSIASSMQKFQAVLSGQVRPIRSISGYDITENTIYDIYSKMGGEKTMRQLSQVEKRLLRIYAVFEQMSQTGATGDMAKTIESAANQARIMSEQLKEVRVWTGQIILGWINNIGLFTYINAALMTMKEIMKSIAFDTGYIAQDWSITALDGVEEVNDAVDELKGKLLSFDRFEALNPTENSNVLGIDPIIESLIKKVSGEMTNVEMKATKISKQWLEQIGLGQQMYRIIDENGKEITMTADKYEKLSDAQKSTFKNVETYRQISGTLKNVVSSLGAILTIIGGAMAFGVVSKLLNISGALKGINVLLTAISAHPIILVLSAVAGLVAYVYKNNEAFRESVNRLFVTLSEKLEPLLFTMDIIIKSIMYALTQFINVITPFMTWWVNMLTYVVNLIDKIVRGVANFFTFGKYGNQKISTPAFATGGFPEDGLFFANSGEMVGQFTNGKTAVANNDQIVTGITQGVYAAMMAYNSQTGGNNRNGDVYLDGTKVGKLVARSSHNEMVRTGLVSKTS